MITAYLACCLVGAGFVAFSTLLGHGSHSSHGIAHGGHAGGAHGAAHGGHAASGDGHSGGVEGAILSYFSPTAIAAYTAGFGGVGLVLTRGLGIENPVIHLPLSAAGAAGFGLALLWTMGRIADRTEKNSLASLDELVGQEAEVTVAIPTGGIGEVAFVAGGTRQTNSARADGGQAFPQGDTVRIARASDGTLWVGRFERDSLGAAVAGEPVAALPKQKVH